MWQDKLPDQISQFTKGSQTPAVCLLFLLSCLCPGHLWWEISPLWHFQSKSSATTTRHTHTNKGTARRGIERFDAHSLWGNSSRKLWGEAECWQLPSEALRMRLLLLQQWNLLWTPCSAVLLFTQSPGRTLPCSWLRKPLKSGFFYVNHAGLHFWSIKSVSLAACGEQLCHGRCEKRGLCLLTKLCLQHQSLILS